MTAAAIFVLLVWVIGGALVLSAAWLDVRYAEKWDAHVEDAIERAREGQR